MVKTNLSPKEVRSIESKWHKIATQLGIPIPPKAAAIILGLEEQDYITYTNALVQENKKVAEQLLQNPQVAALVDNIASQSQQVIIMGDSITAYHFSYAEILRHLLEPQNINVTNWGVGGYTSNHALELCHNVALLSHKPDLVFLSYGVNDAKYFGNAAKMLVSHEEYHANMMTVVEALQSQLDATLVLLTPTLVIEAVANHLSPGFHHSMRWNNNDLLRFGETLKAIANSHKKVSVVDVMIGIGIPPSPDLYLDDGVHLNPKGEEVILTQIAQQLKL